MNIRRIILATILIWVISSLFGWLTCGWLFNWVYTIPPLIWKDPSTITSSTSLIISNIIGLLTSLIFVSIYAVLYRGIPSSGIEKGLIYGFLIWLVGALSGVISMPLYMTISYTVVIYWIIQALILNLLKGAIVALIYKK